MTVLRAAGRRLEGVVLRYGQVAEIGGGLRERVEPGAFAPLGDVVLNSQHDRQRPLARTGGGLTLVDRSDALYLRAELPATREADDVLALVRGGVLRGLSAEFQPVQWRENSAGLVVLHRGVLRGVGVVLTPAYKGSVVQARAAVYSAPAETSTVKHRVVHIWL